MTKPDLRSAVRELRVAMDKTQTEFGSMIGRRLTTVQRYELLVPPKGMVLLRLIQVAKTAGLDEYAEVFRRALRDYLSERKKIRRQR